MKNVTKSVRVHAFRNSFRQFYDTSDKEIQGVLLELKLLTNYNCDEHL